MESSQKIWRKLVAVHNRTKEIMLLCEEQDAGCRTFLQPLNELKNAYEHVVRAKCTELGISSKPAESIEKDLDRALGHEYRAFFDVCDWCSIQLRDKATSLLQPYTREMILKVMPEYYAKVRPELDGLNREIARIRGSKDIANSGELLEQVEHYNTAIQNLMATVDLIQRKIPDLDALDSAQLSEFLGKTSKKTSRENGKKNRV